MFSILNALEAGPPGKENKPKQRVQRVENVAINTYSYTEVSLLCLLAALRGDVNRPFNSKYTYECTIGAEGTKRELVTLYYFKENVVQIKSEGSSLLDFEHKNLFSIKGDVSLTEIREIVIDYLNTTPNRRAYLKLSSIDSSGDINRLKGLLGGGLPKYVIKPRKIPVIVSYEDILKNKEAILNLLQDKLILNTAPNLWGKTKSFRVRVEGSLKDGKGNNIPSNLPSILMEIKRLAGRTEDELHLFFASPLPFWTDLNGMLLAINELLIAEGLGYVIPGIPFQGTFLSFRFTLVKKEQEAILQLLNSN